MKISFQYNRDKDIWCLLNKGKSSNNSKNPTKTYEQLVSKCGENPTPEETSKFIDEHIAANKIDVESLAAIYQKDWEMISAEYQKRAGEIFGITLPKDITAYLTVNNRCPYDIKNNYFYVSVANASLGRKTIMHELWHFYTWYGFGAEQEQKLGKQKYNDLKESLTVLLNIECADLLPQGMQDSGYSQHQELRGKISHLWNKNRNITELWEHLVNQ